MSDLTEHGGGIQAACWANYWASKLYSLPWSTVFSSTYLHPSPANRAQPFSSLAPSIRLACQHNDKSLEPRGVLSSTTSTAYHSIVIRTYLFALTDPTRTLASSNLFFWVWPSLRPPASLPLASRQAPFPAQLLVVVSRSLATPSSRRWSLVVSLPLEAVKS